MIKSMLKVTIQKSIKMKLDMSFSKDEALLLKKHLIKVITLQKQILLLTKGLEGVFEVGNIGPEENIERSKSMYPTVGDIVVDPEGNKHVVASFGFKEVE